MAPAGYPYKYAPTLNVIPAENIKETPIFIKDNNIAFNNSVPDRLSNTGIVDFVNFLSNHSIRYALSDVPTHFFPHHVCEFYYTCVFDNNTSEIRGTINNGETKIAISEETFRRALRLPLPSVIYELPDEDTISAYLLTRIGYNNTSAGNRSNLVLRKCLPAGWKYLTGVLGKCLTQKIGSLDQMNSYEVRVLYALYCGKPVNFARLFFDQLSSLIKEKKRSPTVPYPRWIALCLEHQSTEYAGINEDALEPIVTSPKFFGKAPEANDPGLSRQMKEFLNTPYTAFHQTTHGQVDPQAEDDAANEAHFSDMEVDTDATSVADYSVSPEIQNIPHNDTEVIQSGDMERSTTPPLDTIIPDSPAVQEESHHSPPETSQAVYPNTVFETMILDALSELDERLIKVETDVSHIKTRLSGLTSSSAR